MYMDTSKPNFNVDIVIICREELRKLCIYVPYTFKLNNNCYNYYAKTNYNIYSITQLITLLKIILTVTFVGPITLGVSLCK